MRLERKNSVLAFLEESANRLFVVKAELTEDQKERVDEWAGAREGNLDFSNEVMGGKDRLVLEDSLDKPVTPNSDVQALLDSNGYEISDYRKGLALDKHGREVKIGKVLNRIGDVKVLKKFESDPNRKAGTHNSLKVVITKNPYDVAGMSTDRGWTSCMNLDGGGYNHHVPADVILGTHIAYLVKGDDTDIKNPIGRIALKPYRDEKTGDTILVPEPRVYGSAPAGFEDIVKKWSDNNFPPKKGYRYERNPDLYDDGSPELVVHQSTIEDMINNASTSEDLMEAWDLSINKDIKTLNRLYDKAKSLGPAHENSFSYNLHLPLELVVNSFNKIPDPILSRNVRSIPKAEASLMLYNDTKSDYLKFSILGSNHAYPDAMRHFFNKCVDDKKFLVKDGRDRAISLSAPSNLPLDSIKRFMDLSAEELENINPSIVDKLFDRGLHRMVADNDKESLKYLNKINNTKYKDFVPEWASRLQTMLYARSEDGREIAKYILNRVPSEAIDTYELRDMLRSDNKEFKDAVNKIAARVFVAAIDNKIDGHRRLVRSEALIHNMNAEGIEEISRLMKGKDEKDIRKVWNIVNQEDKHKWNSALLKHMHPENHARYNEMLKDKIHKERDIHKLRELAYNIPEDLEKVLSDRIRYVEKKTHENTNWKHETTASIIDYLAQPEREIIKAELTPAQKKKVMKWYDGRRGSADFSDEAMGGKYRHTIDAEIHKPVVPDREIRNYLEGQGVAIKDYLKGIGVDKHGRDVKIGKTLRRGPESLLKKFESDPNRKGASGKLKVIITKNPYDVAGMSTDRGWTSCMNLEDGVFRNAVPDDVKLGTHIAYLVQEHDSDIEHPVARIALKPMKSGKDTILVPEPKVYGTAPDSFMDAVKKWADDNFPAKEGKIYKMSSRLYDDGTGGIKASMATIKKKIKSNKFSSMEAKGLWQASNQDIDVFKLYCERPDAHPEDLLNVRFVEDHLDDLDGVLKAYALKYLSSARCYSILADKKNPFWLRAEAAKQCPRPETEENIRAANDFVKDAIEKPTYEVDGNEGYPQKSLQGVGRLFEGPPETGANKRLDMVVKSKLSADDAGDVIAVAVGNSLRKIRATLERPDIFSTPERLKAVADEAWAKLKVLSKSYPNIYAEGIGKSNRYLDEKSTVRALKLDKTNTVLNAVTGLLNSEDPAIKKFAVSRFKKVYDHAKTLDNPNLFNSTIGRMHLAPKSTQHYIIDNMPENPVMRQMLKIQVAGKAQLKDRFEKVAGKGNKEAETKRVNKHDDFRKWVHETRRLKDLMDEVGHAPTEELEQVLKDRIRYVMKRKDEEPGWEFTTKASLFIGK